jgi:signal transduction histidine kinase
LQDVSAEKQTEQALIQAREAAEAGSQAKSDFLATVSHELRTPLNGILGFTQLLEDSALCEADREYVRFIATAGEALLGIISDLLDFSRIEAGRLTLEYSTFAMPALLQESLELIRPRAREKGLELQLSIDPSVGILRGDRCRLRQITLNLLSNAVKFTEAGQVSIRCAPYVAGHLRIDVTDSGIGIPPEKQDRLFQRFSQADSSTTRKFGGTGLGLAICKQLLEKMGGQIGLASEAGKGSTFWFIIPVRPPESGQPQDTEVELAP